MFKNRFLTGILLALVSSPVVVYTIYGTHGVHIPLLAATIAGVMIGFIDPERGWLIAIAQALFLLIGVLFLTNWIIGADRIHPDIELQSLYGAVGLTFAGSFIGAFMKKAFES